MFNSVTDPAELITGNRIFAACEEFGIPYCKTDYLRDLKGGDSSVFVTHNGGFNVVDGPPGFGALTSFSPHSWFCEFFKTPMRHWFCLNAGMRSPMVHGIPLGLDNFDCFVDGDRNYTVPPDNNQATEALIPMLGETLPIKNRVYFNLRLDTNPLERGKAFLWHMDQPWVTFSNPVPPEEFFHDILEHEFVVCAAGNGIDSHRIWETLYLGRIPIVMGCRAMDYFAGLPIFWIDEWSDVQPWALDNFLNNIETRGVDLDKLKLSWWENEIKRHDTDHNV